MSEQPYSEFTLPDGWRWLADEEVPQKGDVNCFVDNYGSGEHTWDGRGLLTVGGYRQTAGGIKAFEVRRKIGEQPSEIKDQYGMKKFEEEQRARDIEMLRQCGKTLCPVCGKITAATEGHGCVGEVRVEPKAHAFRDRYFTRVAPSTTTVFLIDLDGRMHTEDVSDEQIQSIPIVISGKCYGRVTRTFHLDGKEIKIFMQQAQSGNEEIWTAASQAWQAITELLHSKALIPGDLAGRLVDAAAQLGKASKS